MYKKFCIISVICLILCSLFTVLASASSQTDDAGEQEEVTEFTNFTDGVIIDDGEGNRFEILSMGETENGYTIVYTLGSSNHDGRPGHWMTHFLVNGFYCNEITDSRQDEFDINAPEKYFFISKEWLDTLGITEIKSLKFDMDLGTYNNYSSFDPSYTGKFAIYTGEKDDTPFEPVIPEDARTIYEDDNVKIILLDGLTTYYEGNLNVQEMNIIYLRKSDARLRYTIKEVQFGELSAEFRSWDPNHWSYSLVENGDGMYLKHLWTPYGSKSEWKDVDLSAGKLILEIYDHDTYESTDIPIDIDLTFPEYVRTLD